MPKRTNTFQQVLALVYWLMAEDGVKVEESAMLPDKDSGEQREVDVLMTGKVGGIPMTVQVEATARAEPADVKWVEMEIGLHESVKTDRLILISESGFTATARTKAEAEGAIPIQPNDFDDEDAVGEVVNRLGTIYQKVLSLTPQRLAGRAEKPDGEIVRLGDLDLTTQIFSDAGKELGTISSEIRRRLDSSFPQLADEIGLADIAGDSDAKFVMGMPDWSGDMDGQAFRACVRWDEVDPPEYHRLIEVLVDGFAEIRVGEIDLTHKKLDRYSLAYGTGSMGEQDVLLVITEDENGSKFVMKIL
jgi:hypothetical protein